MTKRDTKRRLGRLSMDGIDIGDALRGAMEVEPPKASKPKKRKSRKKGRKKCSG